MSGPDPTNNEADVGETTRTGETTHTIEKLTEFCPTFASIMDLISRRWMGVVLRVLLTGPHRFGEIMAAVPGLSDPLLTQRLRELQAKHLLVRRVLPTSPVHVEYELTEAGLDLERSIRVIAEWAEKWWVDDDVKGHSTS